MLFLLSILSSSLFTENNDSGVDYISDSVTSNEDYENIENVYYKIPNSITARTKTSESIKYVYVTKTDYKRKNSTDFSITVANTSDDGSAENRIKNMTAAMEYVESTDYNGYIFKHYQDGNNNIYAYCDSITSVILRGIDTDICEEILNTIIIEDGEEVVEVGTDF